MCQRHGADELETVRNLMAMSLRAVVAEALDADIEAITGEVHLAELGMDAARQVTLRELIADTFDGLEVELSADETFDDLIAAVVLPEFEGLACGGREPT